MTERKQYRGEGKVVAIRLQEGCGRSVAGGGRERGLRRGLLGGGA
jgi:hypothetical protein